MSCHPTTVQLMRLHTEKTTYTVQALVVVQLDLELYLNTPIDKTTTLWCAPSLMVPPSPGTLTSLKDIVCVVQLSRNAGKRPEVSSRQHQHSSVISILKLLIDGSLVRHLWV